MGSSVPGRRRKPVDRRGSQDQTVRGNVAKAGDLRGGTGQGNRLPPPRVTGIGLVGIIVAVLILIIGVSCIVAISSID